MANKNQKEKKIKVELSLEEAAYVVLQEDVGKTVASLLDQVKETGGKRSEPTESQKKIINDLLFNGEHRKHYRIGDKFEVEFVTLNNLGVQNSWIVLSDIVKELDSEPTKGVVDNCRRYMNLAKYLSVYGNEIFYKDSKEVFESKAEIKRRYEFVLSLPNAVSEKLSELQTQFLQEVFAASTAEKIANF
jgi:hypothetical protein